MQSFIMNSHEVYIHIRQGCFAGTGAIVRLPQCQWSKPDGYGKISQCITTTKHSKAKTVCIFLGICCICNISQRYKIILDTRMLFVSRPILITIYYLSAYCHVFVRYIRVRENGLHINIFYNLNFVPRNWSLLAVYILYFMGMFFYCVVKWRI